MPVSTDGSSNPSEQSFAGMIPPRESDDRRALLIHAWSQMAQQHWDLTLKDLGDVERLGPAGRMAQRTAANMRAMQQHRPDIYQRLFKLFPIDIQNRHYRPVRSKGGWMTIVIRTIEGDRLINQLDDPHTAAQRDVRKMAEPFKQDVPLFLCGLSDGYFLEALTHRPRLQDDGRITALYLAEPEPDLLLAVLALHDFSKKDGPIASPWIEWIVGTNWHDQFIARMQQQWMLPVPGLVLGNKQMHAPVKEALMRIKAHRKQTASKQREKAIAHPDYAQPAALAKHLRAKGGRAPRVLLLGSRFENTPQESADQITDGFAELGWETHSLTEPQDHHRLKPLTVWNALGQFKPDLVFDLGNTWAQRRDVIDPRIPIIHWHRSAPGNSNNKPTRAHREALCPRDFILAQVSPLTDPLAAYPARQILPMPGNITIEGNLQHTAAAKPDNAKIDLLFISDCPQDAQDPRDLLEQVANRLTNPKISQLAQLTGEHMLDAYAQQQSFANCYDINQLARKLTPKVKGLKLSDKLYRQLAKLLFAPFNQSLYRQQALQWVVDIASDLPLTLAIYGKGFKDNPTFAPFAHAQPSAADRREKLIASAKINLHIAPSFCLDHSLMQGLATGGFFLVRQHPADALLPELVGFLASNCDPKAKILAQSSDQARTQTDRKHLPQLEQLLERAQWIADQTAGLDPIQCVRSMLQGGLLDRHHVALPRLDQTEFNDAAQLKQRIQRFSEAPDKRLDILKKQRAAIEHRLSFSSGLARTLTRIADLIETE